MSDSGRREGAEPTAPTVEKLDSLPTIAGLDGLRDRLAEGSVIAGRYEIRDLLGIGGMGAVYRAHDRLLDLEVALKVLRGEMATDSSFSQRFRQELLVARSVTHRHVVRIHDLGEHQGMPFMTMDLIAGRSLRQLLLDEGKLPVERALRFVREVAEALGEAHRQGVVHRDLKPSNILIDERGQTFVTDFGVARSLHSPGLTRTGEVLGTPDYLAPEQARGEKVDGRCDLYALGLIFFEMVSGERPYAGGSLLEVLAQHMSGRARTLRDVGTSVPAPVDAIVRRCLAPDPADRYPDAAALIADLDDLGRPGRRRVLRRLEVVAAAALLAVAAGLLWQQVAKVRRERAAAATAATAAAQPAAAAVHSVAILPFALEGTSATVALSAGGLPELVAGALRESAALRVVDSERVAQTLRDLGFEAAALDSHALARLADLLQVDRVVRGRVHAAGEQVGLTLQLGELTGGSLVLRDLGTRTGSPEQLFTLAEQAGEEVRGHLEEAGDRGPARPATTSAAAQQAYLEGTALLANGETLRATPALETAVTEDDRFTAAWVQLSRAYQRQGRLEDALRAAQSANASAGPESGRAGYEARAQEALLREQPEEAQQALAALVERYPHDLAARVALAEAYGSQGNFSEAISSLSAVVERDEKDPRAWYLLGRFAIQAGQAQRAANVYLTKALLLQNELGNRQGQAEVMNALGVAYERLGRVDEAIDYYRQAAELRDALGDAGGVAVSLNNLANLLTSRGDLDGAETALRRALAIHEEMDNRAGVAKIENAFGVLEEERGRYDAALDRYRRALSVRTSLGDEAALGQSYNNVGFAYYLLGQYDNAHLHLERSLALYEKHGNVEGAIQALQSRGTCEIAQGDWGTALKTLHASLERARELNRQVSVAVAYGSLARLAHLEGRYGAALASYREASRIVDQLRFRRGQAEYALGAAETLLELGALAEAAKEVARVDGWRGELGREHLAQLALLQARLLAARGEVEPARRGFATAGEAARASRAPALLLESRLRGAAGERRALQEVLADAQRIGHAALELEAAEAVARAELAGARPAAALDVLTAARQRQRAAGSWHRAWALHHLLANAHQALGAEGKAAEERALARAELARVEQAAPAELRDRFAALPAIREANAKAAGSST